MSFYCGAQDAKISIENSEIKPGGSVNIELSLSDCSEIKSFCLYDFICDSPDIEIESGKWESGFSIIHDNWNSETNDAVIAYTKNTDCNGKIFKLSVKASEQAKPGIYSLTCSAAAKFREESGNEVSVPITIEAAKIEILSEKTVNSNKNDVADDSVETNEDFLENLNDELVISVFDKVIDESGKGGAEKLSENELNSVIGEIVEKSGLEISKEVLDSESMHVAFIEKYSEAQIKKWADSVRSDGNADSAGAVISETLREMNIKTGDKPDESQCEEFVNTVVSEFEKHGIKTADFPKNFSVVEKAAAIMILCNTGESKAVNKTGLIFVAISVCFVGVIVAIVIIKRKNESD